MSKCLNDWTTHMKQNNTMTEKELFIKNLKNSTKKFGVDIIAFCDS